MGARAALAGWLFEFNEVTVTRRLPSLSLSLFLTTTPNREEGWRMSAEETAKGQIFEGGFARQWFIKKHLFKGSPISVPTANSTATSVSFAYTNGWNEAGHEGVSGQGASARETAEIRSPHGDPSCRRNWSYCNIVSCQPGCLPSFSFPLYPTPLSLSSPSSLFLLVFYRRPLFGGWFVGSCGPVASSVLWRGPFLLSEWNYFCVQSVSFCEIHLVCF